jgi:hypothetical protein
MQRSNPDEATVTRTLRRLWANQWARGLLVAISAWAGVEVIRQISTAPPRRGDPGLLWRLFVERQCGADAAGQWECDQSASVVGFVVILVAGAVLIAALDAWWRDWRAFREGNAPDRWRAQYIEHALRYAEYQWVPCPEKDIGPHWWEAQIPGFDGPKGHSVDRDYARRALRDDLDRWITERRRAGEPLPIVDGMSIGIRVEP